MDCLNPFKQVSQFYKQHEADDVQEKLRAMFSLSNTDVDIELIQEFNPTRYGAYFEGLLKWNKLVILKRWDTTMQDWEEYQAKQPQQRELGTQAHAFLPL